ncbi:MAG: 1-acyl-sn-glycerol-3-phosphate acyltransferase [Dehalococcoidales bacterium]|nr:1-acyl-sn-glycerol-3-phosphate acyltransferase [Dehalococcoidales bacterium]
MIRWYYYIARFAVILFFKVFTRWRVVGLKNVPSNGALLIVSNHLSNADPPLLSVTLKRNAIFMAKKELFRIPVLGYIMYGFGAFPVRRGQLDRKALRHAEQVLSDNKILVIFPEATRSKEAKMKKAFPGASLIAVRTDVPIVPTAITGTENVVGLKWMLRRPGIQVCFGEPFHLPEASGRKTRDVLDESTNVVMRRIADLLPAEYRGIYSGQENNDESSN